MSEDIILDIDDLRTSFFVGDNEVKAVDGVTFQVPKGKTLGFRESGSGKVHCLSVLRLVEDPVDKSGSIK